MFTRLILYGAFVYGLVDLGVARYGTNRVCSRAVYRITFNYCTFLHFELIVSVITIIQAMESGGLDNPTTDSIPNWFLTSAMNGRAI
jgi:hypothetical protein